MSVFTRINWLTSSISRRIVLSFMLLLIISFSITAFNIVGLNDVNEKIDRFRQVNANTNLMQKIDKNVSELQRYILVFSHTENTATISHLNTLYNELSFDVQLLADRFVQASDTEKELLDQLQKNTAQFSEKIENLQIQRSYRDDIVFDELSSHFDDLDLNVSSLFSATEKKGNSDFLAKLWHVQLNVSRIEILSNQYLSSHEASLLKQINALFDSTQNIIKSIKNKSATSSFSASLEKLSGLLAKSKRAFNRAVQADRNYLFLVNVVIAGESAELGLVANKLKAESLREQENLFTLTEQHTEFTQLVAIYAALAGALLAVITALLTGKLISKPIVSITNTFGRLIDNKPVDEIPGIDRADEIGQLAQAANVFRQTSAKTKELLEQTEKYANELKESEKELQLAAIKAKEASVAKSQFLASMSHEIRTPMNGVIGMLMLLEKENLSHQQSYYLQLAKSSADSLLVLINDILDMSKIEAGKLDLEFISFDLHKLVSDLAKTMAPRAHEKGLDFILDVEKLNGIIVKGDPSRLRQVLTNLIGNAIKFTESGEILVRAMLRYDESHHLHLHCDICDTGIGIPEDKIGNLFELFTQADASTTRRFGGTGLGLSIVRQLCQLMGGHVSVQSKQGAGSQFSFHIQLEDDISSRANKNVINLAHISVLLVDTNETTLALLSKVLSAWGVNVKTCHSLQACRDLLSQKNENSHPETFDLCLIDMKLSQHSEIAELKQLMPVSNPMTWVVMATLNELSQLNSVTEYGFSTYLHKPVTASDLFDVLTRLPHRQKSIDDASKNSEDNVVIVERRNISENEACGRLRKLNKRVLLVEDNSVNQIIALRFLKDFGLTTDIASNGLEALDKLKNQGDNRIDIVLMDCQMPLMDGYEATRKIRLGEAGQHCRDIVIIAMTANAMQGDKEKCLAAGMTDYLTKPMSIPDLSRHLLKWLDPDASMTG